MGKKATLRLELDRESYQAGDVVNGTVYLSVSDEIKSKAALVLEVNGEEYVKYNEVYGEVAVPHKQIHKLMGDQIVLCDDRQAYAPGEYVYPFNYQLNPTLPGSFHVNRRHAGEICDIDAAVKYELKLRLPLKGVFNSDLKLDQPLKIRASQAMAYPVQTQSGSTAQHAKLLGVIRQGNCELSGTLDRDAYIAGDTLQIRCAISNGSSMEVRSVSVRLYEDLVIHKNSDHEDIKAQTCLVKKDFPGLSAGASLDQVLSLGLVGRADRYAVLPPMTSQMASWTHHVEVSCKFLLSPSVKIEIPVKILPPPSVLEAAAAAPSQLRADLKTKEL
ncbi:hypothetical protein BBO99_00000279 [Phytophthora kernoviae]|uniref:Arrestin C-terminal-like domain-containing protein n=2 Tax=Phytophthora kernoviae TaxID=325452 RepID=A0A3R7G1F7_9STRA|nr:hypothetical protein G195_008611 [Phytophthora kernoviae 00238/432]KAG2527448.1 hypothetical protein JM18_003786 [Phytophthora kernoviae]KAG2528803.1 hypothetical protein JM16_002444 [Phytophthora kernoviae]RLN21318.1 hypothetical protein BBI17_000311 [Phytophthora kernoviae]RLN85747.1 hypothetical protein BBO99_00000279 [Phytophthora kernoviae]